MPKITEKHPQNMHNLLELLFVDLEIWVNSESLFVVVCCLCFALTAASPF